MGCVKLRTMDFASSKFGITRLLGYDQCRTRHLPSASNDTAQTQERNRATKHFCGIVWITSEYPLRGPLQSLDRHTQVSLDNPQAFVVPAVELTQSKMD
ncbi:hypothetical protein D3C85_1665830 [compost metagenome]